MAAALSAERLRLHRAGSGPAVVLLHCLGVDHRLWQATVARLQDRLTLLTYDLPGHGETPVPGGPYTIADLSAQLEDVLRRAGVAQADVVGISLGGLIAQHFAATAPQRVRRLVLTDTTPRYVEEMRRMWVQRAESARTAGPASMTEGIFKIWFTEGYIARNAPGLAYVRECFAATPGEGYALACEALGAADLEPLAPRIGAPTLVLCGDQELPSFLDAARWLAGHIPDARLAWLSPAKHCSVLEQPEAFVEHVERFLA